MSAEAIFIAQCIAHFPDQEAPYQEFRLAWEVKHPKKPRKVMRQMYRAYQNALKNVQTAPEEAE